MVFSHSDKHLFTIYVDFSSFKLLFLTYSSTLLVHQRGLLSAVLDSRKEFKGSATKAQLEYENNDTNNLYREQGNV